MDITNNLLSRIIINPNIMVGKPIIRGTRITVEYILSLLEEGMEIEEILEDYPHLERKDIYACIAFAKEALQNSAFMPLNYPV